MAEVLQIFLCIVSGIPVMRKPLQILFLILVTDLPPSIALGFEPGEALTMKRKPRPKTQPVVVMWMWGGIVANGFILTICIFGTYVIALWAYSGALFADDITSDTRSFCSIWPDTGAMENTRDINCSWNGNSYGSPECDVCIDESIRRAQTCAFIALVWAEGFRAYVSRSFENPVWVQTFSNPSMNKAVLLAQITLFLALFIPGLSDSVLGLYVYEIHGFGWFLAAVGSLSCLVICELFKCFSKRFVEMGELATEDDEPAAPVGVQKMEIENPLPEPQPQPQPQPQPEPEPEAKEEIFEEQL